MNRKQVVRIFRSVIPVVLLACLLALAIPPSVALGDTGQTATTYDPSWQMTANYYVDSTIAGTAKPITDSYWSWTSNVWNPVTPDMIPPAGIPITNLTHSWYMTSLTLDSAPEQVVLVNRDDNGKLYFNDDIYAYVNGSMVACGGAASREDYNYRLPGPLPSGFVTANADFYAGPGYWIANWRINGGLNLPLSAFHVGENTIWILLETLDGLGGLARPVFVLDYSAEGDQFPNQPSNISPANSATDVNLIPTLQSSVFSDPDVDDTHAASQWQVTTIAGDYSSPFFDSGHSASNLTSITIPSGTLAAGTTCFWHVRHQDNNGACSEWSAETSFTTVNRPPSQPSNCEPGNGAAGISLTPTLQSSSFSDPDTGDNHAASDWQITATLGDYSSPVYESLADTVNLTSIVVPSGILHDSTIYYWHVRYQDNHGNWSKWSDWSTETSFVTVHPRWDINQDGVVNYKDLAILGGYYGTAVGHPGFNPGADINEDGVINYKDLAILGAHYGEVY